MTMDPPIFPLLATIFPLLTMIFPLIHHYNYPMTSWNPPSIPSLFSQVSATIDLKLFNERIIFSPPSHWGEILVIPRSEPPGGALVIGYRVYANSGIDDSLSLVFDGSGSPSVRIFKHTGLTAGRRYWYQVGRGKNVDMIGREVLSFVFGRFFLSLFWVFGLFLFFSFCLEA